MYAKYVIEREGISIIESEVGFVTYYFINDQCYIKDLYIDEKYRRTGEGFKFGDEISKIAKDKGCTKSYGTVCPTSNGSTESLKGLLKYGFKLDSCINNFIALVKEL